MAGDLSLKTDCSFGFCPKANWDGDNLWTFTSEFFAFTHHAKTSWNFVSVSPNVLPKTSEMIRLCDSINLLLNLDPAAVVATLMFIDSHISKNLLFGNSPLLSVRNFSADPYICIQQKKMALITVSGSFDGMTFVAGSCVAWSMRWNNISYNKILRSMAAHSWNDDVKGNSATGLGGGFW